MNPLVEKVLAAAKKLERGCDCEYDYRCGRCQRILDVIELIEELDAQPSIVADPVAMPEEVKVNRSQVNDKRVYAMVYHMTMSPDQARAIARELNAVADEIDRA